MTSNFFRTVLPKSGRKKKKITELYDGLHDLVESARSLLWLPWLQISSGSRFRTEKTYWINTK